MKYQAGANPPYSRRYPTRTDEAGRTALAVAERNSQSELITLLKEPA